MPLEGFADLKRWQEARKPVQIVYRLTKRDAFRGDRTMGWPLQEAAVSSMGHIAKAQGRYALEDERRFLDMALGSCREVQSHLYAALDAECISQTEFAAAYRQAEVVGQLISGAVEDLDRQMSNRPPNGPLRPRRRL